MKNQIEIESMLVDELVEQINKLAHKQKQEKLSDHELGFQKQLRHRYIELYRRNFQ